MIKFCENHLFWNICALTKPKDVVLTVILDQNANRVHHTKVGGV